jgi:hypothetical protein
VNITDPTESQAIDVDDDDVEDITKFIGIAVIIVIVVVFTIVLC